MPEPADPKWKQRRWQSRYQTKESYFSWCGEMATYFMDAAKQLAKLTYEEEARHSQETAQCFRDEMEEIVQHG